MSKSILWIVPKWPYPEDDGAKKAISALVRGMSGNYVITLVVLTRVDDKVKNLKELKKLWNLKEIMVIPTKASLNQFKRFFNFLCDFVKDPFLPLTIGPYHSEIVRSKLNKIINNEGFNYILFDGVHVAASCENLLKSSSNGPKLIYRAHNIEFVIWKRAAKTTINLLKKILLLWQSELMKKFEMRVVNRVDMTASVSKEDRDYYRSISNIDDEKIVFCPIGVKEKDFISYPEDKEKLSLLYIARLDWPPNRDGLKWFLEHVWPKILASKKDIKLDIIGSGESSWLKNYSNMSNVKVHGLVESLDCYYENSHAVISPIFYGSGTRVKVLEAASYGRCCISTKMAMEGSGLGKDMYIEANNEDEWVSVISNIGIEKLESYGKKAGSFVKEHYNEKSIGLELSSLLEKN